MFISGSWKDNAHSFRADAHPRKWVIRIGAPACFVTALGCTREFQRRRLLSIIRAIREIRGETAWRVFPRKPQGLRISQRYLATT
jgi:hypothetical protein